MGDGNEEGRGPGDVAGARAQQWGLDLPRPPPQRHSHALSCRADPAMLRAFTALEKALVGSARAP